MYLKTQMRMYIGMYVHTYVCTCVCMYYICVYYIHRLYIHMHITQNGLLVGKEKADEIAESIVYERK